MNNFTALCCIFLLFFQVSAQKLKPIATYKLKIKEPSDLCFTPDNKGFLIVSDNGILYKTDLEGKILQTSSQTGIDFEGVCLYKGNVLVSDETPRHFFTLDIEKLEQISFFELTYLGGRNSGFEAITFNEEKNSLMLITEKNPIWIFELDHHQKIVGKHKFKYARDISAATFQNGFLYLLSDEDRTVFKLNPINYELISKLKIPVINPEGLAIDKIGNMYILSDDRELLYHFKLPTNF